MKERKLELTREYYRSKTFYDFRVILHQERWSQYLKLAHGGKALSHDIPFRWFTEFCRGQNSLLDKEYTGRSSSAIIPENVNWWESVHLPNDTEGT